MAKKSFLGQQSIDEATLAEINKFTKRTLNAEEVYAFSVVLCDNEIDRDFERFTSDSLEQLKTLFVGKTGIFDHSMKGKDQIARIFKCYTEQTGETTSFGEPYKRLVATAYLPITERNKDFILSLDAGITKEVSVGCAVSKETCSVCGADLKNGYCGHRKGELYEVGDTLIQCHALLEDPCDAYEWSFVAVPAQRKAGVIKAYDIKGKDGETMDVKELVKAFGEDKITLSKEQSALVKQYIGELESVNSEYLDSLQKSAVKAINSCLPGLDGETLSDVVKSLTPKQLKAFCYAAGKKKCAELQLGTNGTKAVANAQFSI